MNKDYKRWTERAKDGSPALITERIFYEIKKSQGEGKKHYFADNGDVLDIVTRYLAELEDKIENGILVEFPRIIHPNRMEWFVQYQYPNGVVQYYICFSEAEAQAKLRELKENNNEQD